MNLNPVRARRVLGEELRQRGWTAGQLTLRRKGDPKNVKTAGELRRETTMTPDWIAGYAAQCLRETRG